MVICLFTDFGSADIYVGQVRTVLHEYAPQAAVIDLAHEAPAFNVRASAHLLAALADRLPEKCVVLAVVDPGVGGEREPVIVRADGRWVIGPDNGIISVLAARATAAEVFPVSWRPAKLSASFHGRDLFAPFAGMLASGALDTGQLEPKAGLDVDFGAADLAEIIYIDHYGNAMSGLRAAGVGRDARFSVNGHLLAYARVFSAVPPGTAFWYENSLGLVELAANAASAAEQLGIRIGNAVATGV
jgi:S-adenosyl-L-methionine hydrolase (adenosine-forming)